MNPVPGDATSAALSTELLRVAAGNPPTNPVATSDRGEGAPPSSTGEVAVYSKWQSTRAEPLMP